ncbi:MAG: PKD domain-containing protein [Pseudomonadota bacterium]
MLDLVFTGVNSDAMTDYTEDLVVTLKPPVVPGVNAAPAAAWFEVDSVTGADARVPTDGEVYDEQYHLLYYVWDFGDGANATPTTTLNLPARWKDVNEGRGRMVAHAFNDPGTYTVTCEVFEPVTRRFGRITQQVTVGDPDTVFPTTQTLVLDPAGAHAAHYPSGARAFTSWGALSSAWASGSSQQHRILLAPGVDETFDGTGRISAGALSAQNVRIGALRSGVAPRPILRKTGAQGDTFNDALIDDRSSNSIEVALYGIGLIGEWDSTTENGRWVRCINGSKTGAFSGNHLTMTHRCAVSGFESAGKMATVNPGSFCYNMFSDTEITNWQNYGIVAGPSGSPSDAASDYGFYTAVVGSSIPQDINALSGGQKTGLWNTHGSLRDLGSVHLYVSASDLFARNGWSTGSGSGKNGLAITSDNPALRINTTTGQNKAAYIDRVGCEGAFVLNNATGDATEPGNYVIDGLIQFLSSMNYATQANVTQMGGTTLRNTLMIKLNVPEYSNTTDFREFFAHGNDLGDANNGAAGVYCHNVTGLDLRSTANFDGSSLPTLIAGSSNPFPVIFDENNLLHVPNVDGASPISGETLDLTDLLDGYAPRHKGPRIGFSIVRGRTIGQESGGSDVANGATLTIPYALVLDGAYDSNTGASGNATSQAYWQAIEATDMLHRIIATGGTYHADLGQIGVAFTASGVEITNMSGVTWTAGTEYQLKLDRASLLPNFPSEYDATLQPLMAADATDPTTKDAPSGLIAYDDVKGVERVLARGRKGVLAH